MKKKKKPTNKNKPTPSSERIRIFKEKEQKYKTILNEIYRSLSASLHPKMIKRLNNKYNKLNMTKNECISKH